MSKKRYTISDNAVTDAKTSLTWQREVSVELFTLAGAKKYAKALKLGGYSDWRLPTIEELQSIIDFSRFGPAIDPITFPDTPAKFFWSSSPNALYTSSAWGVHFFNGYTYGNGTADSYRVRCVR